MELLSAPFFEMYDNISTKTGLQAARDLTDRPKNQLVLRAGWDMDPNVFSEKYDTWVHHNMLDEIALARRLAFRLLRLRLKMVKRNPTLDGEKSEVMDGDINQETLMAGLIDCDSIPEMKIMGALMNPLLQNDCRMVAAGMCTWSQVEAGKEMLLDRVSRYYERQSTVVTAPDEDMVEKTNKWSKLKHPTNITTGPSQLALNEFKLWERYNDVKYLPVMKPYKTLGAITRMGQPQEPVYFIGPVTEKGVNLPGPGKRNHADYVDKSGYYMIAKYLDDFQKVFPSMSNIGTGQLCPHISTEVDCESLFSQAGFMSHPRRARTSIRMYERLVMGKHRLHRIYCSIPRAKELFLERWKANNWDEKEERDDQEFLEVEKEIHIAMFPDSACLPACLLEDEVNVDSVENVDDGEVGLSEE